MPRLRHLLGRLTMLWLLCQSTSMALVPAILGPLEMSYLLECTCAHGDHASCPMHHRPTPGSNRCAMRGLADFEPAVVASLLGPVGVIAVGSSSIAPPQAVSVRPLERSTIVFRAAPPDPPPT